jgi:hypothetical protein
MRDDFRLLQRHLHGGLLLRRRSIRIFPVGLPVHVQP